MTAFLTVQDLSIDYGNIRAVRHASFSVRRGEIAAVIGSNGAGKSTILNAICGLRPLATGSVQFMGEDISAKEPHLRTRQGIAQVPEGRRIFGRMSVAENIMVGANWRRDSARIAEDYDRALSLFPRLRERIGQIAGTLSGGEQQMLAIARALMSSPTLLLLDEPSMGLAPQIVDLVFDSIQSINRDGITVVLVEQNATRALEIASNAFVLQNGEITLSGTGAQLADDPRVRAAYLGVQEHHI